jgi:hypothetical protein
VGYIFTLWRWGTVISLQCWVMFVILKHYVLTAHCNSELCLSHFNIWKCFSHYDARIFVSHCDEEAMFITLVWWGHIRHTVTIQNVHDITAMGIFCQIVKIGKCSSHFDIDICLLHCGIRKCLTHYDVETMLIMVNHVGPCWLWLTMFYYCIAMLIRFSSLDCDISFCLPHHIIRLWSSHCNVWF